MALGAKTVDAELDHVAGFQIQRGFLTEADSGWGAGGDDVAGEEGHELAEVADDKGNVEDEVAGVAVLKFAAVDGEPEAKFTGVGHLIGGDEPRAEGGEGVGALALDPLATAFELPGAFAVVVVEHVASDAGGGLGGGNVAGHAANDDSELDLPVGFFGVARDDEVVVGADDRGGRLEEHDRFGGRGHAGFGGVVAVVKADADNLARAGDRASEAGSRWNDRRSGGVLFDPRGEPVQSAGFKEGLVEIGGAGGNIDGGSVGEKDARFFRALGAEFDEFHSVLAKKSEAAVDVVGGTSDEGGFVRAEKRDERGDFLWFTHAADGLTR